MKLKKNGGGIFMIHDFGESELRKCPLYNYTTYCHIYSEMKISIFIQHHVKHIHTLSLLGVPLCTD